MSVTELCEWRQVATQQVPGDDDQGFQAQIAQGQVAAPEQRVLVAAIKAVALGRQALLVQPRVSIAVDRQAESGGFMAQGTENRFAGAHLDLKGDANASADPAVYEVTTVRKVLWHVPGLARVIVYFSNPLVLGAITLTMAALVVAVFWPRNTDDDDDADSADPKTEPIQVLLPPDGGRQ